MIRWAVFFSNMTINLKNNSLKKFIPIVIVVITAAIAIILIVQLLGKVRNNTNTNVGTSKVSVQGAKSTVDINQEFSFTIKDNAAKKITDLKFNLETAELRDEIIVKGSRANAIEGRTFLIVNIKITSAYTKALQINTQDYFRLTVNGKEDDLLAADIHNDPLVIQPTSTKFARIGFAINDTDKNISLLVGEIGGEKTKIDLNLQ